MKRLGKGIIIVSLWGAIVIVLILTHLGRDNALALIMAGLCITILAAPSKIKMGR